MSSSTVLIVGCGVAGPVIARLLKAKGYDSIVFEKVSRLGDAGASLMLMPNGLKVLNLVGVTPALERASWPLQGFLDCTSNGDLLGFSNLPESFKTNYGQHAMGVKRTDLNLKLKALVLDSEIDIREGWELEDIEETDSSLTAHFKGGRTVSGAFLIGCDGIKAASRRVMLKQKGFGEESPTFTGLTQTAGLSPTPASLKQHSCMRNWYGQGVHVISYPVSSDITSWALTLPEESGSEAAWGLFTADEMEERKRKLLVHVESWKDEAPKQLIQSANRIIKFGLYDREEMQPHQWFSKRTVLIGDAAHPTSPHLGQGANQALEDCFHLSRLLPDLSKKEEPFENNLTHVELADIFRTFAESRQPRTAALVKGARTQGQTRVVTAGPEACERRDELVAATWKNIDAIKAKYENLCREPFQEQQLS